MTEREALKLALEALEVANSCVDGYYIPKGKTHLPEVEEAITAIEKVLAQPEFVLNGIDCSCGRKWRVVNNTLTASAQPEQEPVAFICQGNAYMADDVDEYCTAMHIPLYTTPPQRTWVGLTDEEREELMDIYDVASTDYAQAIEAKLKGKNNG